MKADIKNQKKKDLGIFYTPEAVVQFIFDMLNILKIKEDEEQQRWHSRIPAPHYPSIIDPAVGEGVFLKGALISGFTQPKYVFGVDIDEAVKEKWVSINLLKSFGSRAELDKHFFHQNGLMPLDDDQVIRYKKGGLQEFDTVVGNPPYGGIGVDFEGKLTQENRKLLDALERFEILSYRKHRNNIPRSDDNKQGSLFAQAPKPRVGRIESGTVIQLTQSIPVEILFVERFIQLARPGGWIAIIIPDGILANSNLHYVRKFIAAKTKVLAIVSLPRDTFKLAGTNAKTSILFLQKYSSDISQSEGRNQDYPVFLASINKLDDIYFRELSNSFKEFLYYGKFQNDKNNI